MEGWLKPRELRRYIESQACANVATIIPPFSTVNRNDDDYLGNDSPLKERHVASVESATIKWINIAVSTELVINQHVQVIFIIKTFWKYEKHGI